MCNSSDVGWQNWQNFSCDDKSHALIQPRAVKILTLSYPEAFIWSRLWNRPSKELCNSQLTFDFNQIERWIAKINSNILNQSKISRPFMNRIIWKIPFVFSAEAFIYSNSILEFSASTWAIILRIPRFPFTNNYDNYVLCRIYSTLYW